MVGFRLRYTGTEGVMTWVDGEYISISSQGYGLPQSIGSGKGTTKVVVKNPRLEDLAHGKIVQGSMEMESDSMKLLQKSEPLYIVFKSSVRSGFFDTFH